MIVNDGKVQLLNSQLTYIAGLYWGLFSSNTAITLSTVFSALTEASWAGYSRALVGPLGAAAIVANKAASQPTTQPSFGNSSGSSQNFYGWFLLDASAGKLIAAVNLGLQVLANGGTYPLATVFTDDQQ